MKMVESPGDSKEDKPSKVSLPPKRFCEPAVQQVTNGLRMRRTARCFQSLKRSGSFET